MDVWSCEFVLDFINRHYTDLSTFSVIYLDRLMLKIKLDQTNKGICKL